MRIGILTFYYNSVNYGGVLQSFALCTYLRRQGYDAEQICLCLEERYDLNLKRLKREVKQWLQNKRFKRRYNLFKKFRDEIDHSVQVYDAKTIKRSQDIYDVYISGSDQVWNLDWYNPAFFLEFADDEKKKIAYAVSLGRNKLTPEEEIFLRNTVKNFTAVSVRENDAIGLLGGKNIFYAIDPVFLLNRSEWDKISAEPLIQEKYIYCHLIGDGIEERRMAESFAKTKQMKLACIPHPSRINKNDEYFGDIQINNAGPREFISLIKNAEYVITDSFHCCAFSAIFHKQFFAMHRLGKEGMASRVLSVLELLNAKDHFCDTSNKYNPVYLSSQPDIDYHENYQEIELLIEKSKKFLQDNLNEE